MTCATARRRPLPSRTVIPLDCKHVTSKRRRKGFRFVLVPSPTFTPAGFFWLCYLTLAVVIVGYVLGYVWAILEALA